MKKFIVETYYTCTFKTVHTLNDLNDQELSKIDNRTDGSVEVIAEGIKEDIEDLLDQIRTGMGSAITRECEEVQVATDEFTGFSIRM